MNRARNCRAALAALILGFGSFLTMADTLTVHPDGPPTADFATIQEAIDAAFDLDCISVEPGTYVENIDFMGKAITIQSTGGEDMTIIDGSACTTGILSCSVVTFASGEGEDSILDGFTIMGGSGSAITAPFDQGGGGVFCDAASPTLLNCRSARTRQGARVRECSTPIPPPL